MGKKVKNTEMPIITEEQQLLDNSSTLLNNSQQEQSSAQTIIEVLKYAYVGIFSLLNTILMAFTYFLLIFQTLYIIGGKEPKYINLRHIAIKWLITYVLVQIKRGYSHKLDVNSQLMIISLDCIILLIAFPSRALKTIHLKYFSHKQQKKFQSSVKDPKTYDITFGQRLLTSIIGFLLIIIKHLIAFVPPNFRKSMEQPIRNINKVMIEKKCFWSIYEDHKEKEQEMEREKKAMVEALLPPLSIALRNQSSMINSKQRQISAIAQQCSVHTMKPIKKINIKYNPMNSELQITDLDFNRSSVYTLEELVQKDPITVEFLVLDGSRNEQQTIIAKFKGAKDLENFLKSIEEAESMMI